MTNCCRCGRGWRPYRSNTPKVGSIAERTFDSNEAYENICKYLCKCAANFLNQSRFYYPGVYAGNPNVPMCDDCWDYLHNREIRQSIDNSHRYATSDTSSRFSPLCREFDIRYGLLNKRTKLYWDEKTAPTVRDFSQTNSQRRHDSQNYSRKSENQFPRQQNNSNLFYPTANERIKNGSLFQRTSQGCYEALKHASMNDYQSDFAQNFQTYIVRLGLAINDVCKKKIKGNNRVYANAIGYICKAIIHDSLLYDELIGINKLANIVKHSSGNIMADINRYLTYYNSMIDRLVSVSGCEIFKKCHVYAKYFPDQLKNRKKNKRYN